MNGWSLTLPTIPWLWLTKPENSIPEPKIQSTSIRSGVSQPPE